MTRLVVQAAFGYTLSDPDPVWTDLTDRVDTETGVRIDRGASDELSEVQPGICRLALDNADGALTPGRADSPYYPNVRKHVPIRVMAVTADKNLIREGSFDEDPPGSGIHPITGWERGNPEPFTSFPDETHALYGSSSYQVNWEEPPATDPGIVQSWVYGLTIGTTHTASAWVWVDVGAQPVRLQIAGGPIGAPSTTTGAWEQITVTFTATAATALLQFTAIEVSPSGITTAWMDQIQVEEGTTPTTFDPNYAVLHHRFYGTVNQWPLKWDGLQSTVTITCTDLFKDLGEQDALQPMLTEEVLLRGPLAYYPLSEPSNSTSAGDISGTSAGPLTIVQAGAGGKLTFGQGEQEAAGPSTDGLPVPLFAPVGATAGKYLQADLGADYVSKSNNFYLYFEVWFATTVKDNRCVFALESRDRRYRVVFGIDAVGGLFIDSTGVGGTLGRTSPLAGDLADGQVHQVVYDERNAKVYVDDGSGFNVSVSTMFRLQDLWVGGYRGAQLWDGTIAHLALYAPESAAPGWYTDHYVAGTTAFVGEAADVRAARIADYAGLALTGQGSTFDGMASQGHLGKTALQHLRDIEVTESGRLIADRAGPGLVLQSRDLRFNPTPVTTLEYADLETDDVELTDDDQKLTNIVGADRPGGATIRVLDQPSIDAYGPKKKQLTLYKDTDLAVADTANWIVQRYADPPPEIRQVPVEAYTMPLAVYRALLDADVSTALALTGLPAQAPEDSATVTVEGYSETIGYNSHRLDFHTSRTTTDSVWILDDPVYSQLGITTRLAY